MKARIKIFYVVLGICLAGIGSSLLGTNIAVSSDGNPQWHCNSRYQISAGYGGAFVIDTVSGLVFYASADSKGGVKFHGPPALITSALLKESWGE